MNDLRHLEAACGWLELGNPAEARQELEKVDRRMQWHPDVLELRWKIYAAAGRWRGCLRVAQVIVDENPGLVVGWLCLSMALHALHDTEEAWENLYDVVEEFPDVPAIRYELARYSCALGWWLESLRWLEEATRVGDAAEVMKQARSDPDMKPLWARVDALERHSGLEVL